MHDHERWMERAIEMAARGRAEGEWPFGAVVVREGIEISAAYSTERCTGNPAGHAELHAIERAGFKYGTTLRGCTLYTTHEPCVMCSGLILQAKPSRLVIGTMRADRPDLFNPRRDPCATLLRRNGNPGFPIEVVQLGGRVRLRCLALFDGIAGDGVATAA